MNKISLANGRLVREIQRFLQLAAAVTDEQIQTEVDAVCHQRRC
jgi:hypothetical protein